MPLSATLSDHWRCLQGELFPWLEEQIGPLGERYRMLVAAVELVRIERFLPHPGRRVGRPRACRSVLARAFMAKVVFGLATTGLLRERLLVDRQLRWLCGLERAGQVPSEATFSRAFAMFARTALPERAHAALIEATQRDRLIGHIARDSTAIPARERPPKALTPPKPPKRRKRGRPHRGEERPKTVKPARRLEVQPSMTLDAMLADLPCYCSIGTKSNAKGHNEIWRGYKLHVDVANGDIPVSCILTSAHVHDSQAAIPLATMSAARVTNLYDLMDSAYDAAEIHAHSRALGHVPIIDPAPKTAAQKADRAQERLARRHTGHQPAQTLQLAARTACERVNSRLKDNVAITLIRVRGPTKVMCQLMFGILVIAADQIFKLVA